MFTLARGNAVRGLSFLAGRARNGKLYGEPRAATSIGASIATGTITRVDAHYFRQRRPVRSL